MTTTQQQFRVVFTTTWQKKNHPDDFELRYEHFPSYGEAYHAWEDYMCGHTSGFIRMEVRTITKSDWEPTGDKD